MKRIWYWFKHRSRSHTVADLGTIIAEEYLMGGKVTIRECKLCGRSFTLFNLKRLTVFNLNSK